MTIICLTVYPSVPKLLGFTDFLSVYLPTQAVCCIPSLLQIGSVTKSAFTPLYQSGFLFRGFACSWWEFVPLSASFTKAMFKAQHNKTLGCLCKKRYSLDRLSSEAGA